MKKRIWRTRQVEADIIEIYRYLHARSPQAAEKVLDAIEHSIKSLLDISGFGRRWLSPRPELEGMRVTVVSRYRNYLIFFRAAGDGVEIFRIVHGAREIDRIVEEMEIDFGAE